MVRIIRWLEKHKVPLDSSVLDIGTGNGVLLVELVGICKVCVFFIQNQSSLNTVLTVITSVAVVIMGSCNLCERQKVSVLQASKFEVFL